MKNQPFVIPLIGLAAGIILFDCSSRFSIPNIIMGASVVLLLVLAFVLYYRKYQWVSISFVFILTGFFISLKYNSFHPLPEELKNTEAILKMKVKETYRSSENHFKYKAEILSVDSLSVPPTYALLYWRKENAELYHGDEVWLLSKIQDALPTRNPHQFDYTKYLQRQRIHYTVFSDTLFKKTESKRTVDFVFSSFKKRVLKKLGDSGYSKSSVDLIGAMLLGDRTEIDRGMEESFRKTGVVHILAISGLHVMMVYSIFMFLLYPVLWLPNGKFIRILICLLLLWGFVFFVGFKVPVFRSALMISIYYMTMLFRRKPNIWHTLCLTAFILLMLNPNFLFDPGFILSYSAVFFIVYLNPVFIDLINPKTKISRALTVFFATTTSAQIGTFPATVYFFNLSSGLFIFGNLVMIPVSYFMIAGGMGSLFLTETGLNFKPWIWLFNKINEWSTFYIHWLANFNDLIFDKISLNLFEVILVLIFLLLLKLILTKPKFSYVFSGLLLLFIFQIQRFYQIHKSSLKKELIIFHQTKNTVKGIRDGRRLDVFIGDMEDSAKIYNYVIKPYEIKEKIKYVEFYNIRDTLSDRFLKTSNVLLFEDQTLLVADSDFKGFIPKADYLLIRDNSTINPDSISSHTEIIIDGSNYPNYKTSEFKNPIWKTIEKGARIIELD